MAGISIEPGAVIYIDRSDPNDPKSVLEAYLVEGETWTCLGNSFGAGQDGDSVTDGYQNFLWMVYGLAAFHDLPLQDESGVERL